MNLFEQALQCLQINEPQKKVAATLVLNQRWRQGELSLEKTPDILSLSRVGRPEKPELVDPRNVPRRSFSTLKGRLTLAHAIAHIEFNAINLALDAVYRFQDMPPQYYTDWCKVAAEEAEHFTLLTVYLQQHEMAYGDLPAHNGLWEMAVKTDFDVLVRMALVPRVLEARGLDVTPGMISKLEAIGDTALVNNLRLIFNDEIGHVRIGTHWYKYLCRQRGLEPKATFLELIAKHMQGARFGPFDTDARIQAGFTEDELQSLLNHFN